jgi:exodeoxyribonuclease III
MKIVTWNVNGLRAREAQILELVSKEAPDVLCLQEIKANATQVPLALGALSDYATFWHGAGGYSGVALAMKKSAFPEAPVFSHPPYDRETRVVEARAGGVTYASIYLPNGGKDYDAKIAFLEAMDACVAEACARGDELVLSGDMNVTRGDLDVHPSQKDEATIGQRPDERALFERILSRGLVDVARTLHPDDARMFTWWPYWKAARQRNLGWRIDLVLATPGIAKRATSCVVQREFGSSDHAPLIVEVA